MARRPHYPADILAVPPKRRPPRQEVRLRLGLHLTDLASRFTGTVVEIDGNVLTLAADDDGGRRAVPFEPDRFALDGRPVRLTRQPVRITRPATASGATRVAPSGAVVSRAPTAKVARASRIWVEGTHDAQLLERVWGDELRELAIVVEPLHGADDLVAHVRSFRPGPQRRLGVLLDHLVPGSKESRLAQQIRDPDVLITGHPYVDVWAGVRPRVLGLAAWPEIPPGRPWKEGVAEALGVADHRDVWRRALGGVRNLTDLQTPLVGTVEQLLDHLTADEF